MKSEVNVRYILLAVLLVATPASAQVKSDIRFPTFVAPSPGPAPAPVPVKQTLSADLVHIIEADKTAILIASPEGLVKITEEAGPVRFRGKFMNGPGKVETRTFSAKQVFIIEAIGTGKVELIVVPAGATTSADVIRKTVDVDSGQAPQPPPTPPTPPKPVDPAPIPVAGFRVLLVEESADRGKLTPGQFRVMFGKKMRDWLDANCAKEGQQPAYRIYDKDAKTAGDLKHWQDAMLRARTQVPWIVISNGVTGFEGPLPATEDETLALLQKYLTAKGIK